MTDVVTALGDATSALNNAVAAVLAQRAAWLAERGAAQAGWQGALDAANAAIAAAKSAVPRGSPVNLRVSNRLNYEQYTVQISADEVVLQDAGGNRVRRSGTVYITNNVAGANGYDAASQIVAYGNYDLYWIYNPATNTDAGLMVTEQNGPTLPAGYTFARRLGWGRLDSAKNWHRYEQRGEEWAFKISPNMFPMTPPQVANGQIGFNGNTPTGYQEINLGGIIPARSTHVDLSLNATQTASNMIAVAPSLSWALPATGYSGQIMFASSQDANQGPFPTNMKVRVPLETPPKIYLCQQSSCITAVLGGRLEI